MANSDDDTYVNNDSYAKLSDHEDEEISGGEDIGKEKRRSPRIREKSSSPARAVVRASLPSDLRQIYMMERSITKRLKGYDIDQGLSLRVLAAALHMKKEWLVEKRKLSVKKRKHHKPLAIRKTICSLFRISPNTYSKITSSYFNERKFYLSGRKSDGRSGNSDEKDTRIPRTVALQIEVRDFVRSRRSNRSRVTGRQVLDFFIQKGFISIPQDETGKYLKTPFDSAYRATLRWLSEFGGYKRGKRNNIVPRADQVAKRHYFLREFFKNRQLPAEDRLREVYTDESYIHEHYSRHEDSLWDPNDEQDVQVGKGIHRKEHID